MAHSIEMTSIDDQIPLLPQTENNEIEEGRKVDHLIDIKDANGQDPSGSHTKKFGKQFFDEAFEDLNNSSIKWCTIFKVNVWLRESKPDAYTPKMLFIGPYHKKNFHLDPMKSYKLLYLQRFLRRKDGLTVESCIRELEKLKEEALKCYDDVETDNFCEMLLLDGCFVVEFIRERCGLYPIREEEIININNGDYIFRDLMLLENQLPFFVLDQLHEMTMRDHELPLAILVCDSFPLFVDLPEMTLESFIETGGCYNIKHLLHLVHRLSCHGTPMKKLKLGDIMYHKVMPNATELSEAGVRFAKASVTTSFFDSIKFKNGLMKIPCFKVIDSTETLLRNLIAYEQQTFHVRPKYFSEFATFMDYLIDSDEDVNLLRQNGIIENWIGDDKGVACVFNKIGNGVTKCHDFYYKEECIKAIEHSKKTWNRLIASLIRNYFSSPWVGASTVAAIILLILTTMQTILAFTGSNK